MQPASSEQRKRVIAGIGAATLQLLIGAALITGLAVRVPVQLADAIEAFEVALVLPPEPAPVRQPVEAKLATAAAASMPPEPIVTIDPIVTVALPLPVPSIVASPSPAADPGAGIAKSPGSNTGTDAGTDVDAAIPAQRLKGGIKSSDYPDAAYRARIGGSLLTRFVVGINGRVTQCSATESSGNAELDAATCQLIIRRYRYKPARDAQGHPVASTLTEGHSWIIDDDLS